MAGAKWRQLEPLPGTPRLNHAVACISGSGRKHVYVIGGVLAEDDGKKRMYSTVLDNWVFDVEEQTWTRLQDSPVVSGNWPRAVAYRNRYVLLVGGAGYERSVTNNGPKVPVADSSQRHPALLASEAVAPPWQRRMLRFFERKAFGGREYSNGFLVYDTGEDKFLWTDPLPLDINGAGVVVHGDELFVVGGETSAGCALGKAFGRHPDTIIRVELSFDAAKVAAVVGLAPALDGGFYGAGRNRELQPAGLSARDGTAATRRVGLTTTPRPCC